MQTYAQIDDKWKPIHTASADVESSYHIMTGLDGYIISIASAP